MNDAERSLDALLSGLGECEFDSQRIERAGRSLAAGLSALSRETPRVELERIMVMHGALRDLVGRRQAETGRALEAVIQARARCSRLTRPEEIRTVVDVDA